MIARAMREAPLFVRLATFAIGRLPAGRYRLIELLSRRPPPPFLMHLPLKLGGASYACDLRDSVAREACFSGRYGPQETAIVRALLKPGMTFVDVGANWGYFTLIGAHLTGARGRVVSLEPDPRLHEVLGENVARNGMTHVQVLPVAAGAARGSLMLAGYDETAGNFGLSRIVKDGDVGGTVFEVESKTLDQIAQEEGIEEIDLLKMDIEGGEAAAIAGAAELLRQGRIKRLLVELHPRELAELGSSVAELGEILIGAGYSGFRVNHDPAVTREWAYGRGRGMAEIVRPLDREAALDTWPHQLWCAPDVRIDWES